VIDRPEHGDQSRDSPAQDSRAEQVLSQALRAMVGGDNPSDKPSDKPGATAGVTGDAGTGPGSRRRLTTGQLLLLAAIVGLLVGIAVGLLSLLL
jgi:hypothetical protein